MFKEIPVGKYRLGIVRSGDCYDGPHYIYLSEPDEKDLVQFHFPSITFKIKWPHLWVSNRREK